MVQLSFVIPCYRSEHTILQVLNEIEQKMTERPEMEYEVITVNDNSPDQVLQVLTDYAETHSWLRVVDFTKNFGQHAAMMAGLSYAAGKQIVFLDDDFQCPMDKLWELLEPLNHGYDVSLAQYKFEDRKESFFRVAGSRFNDFMMCVLLDKPKHLRLTNFMAMQSFIAAELLQYKNPYPYIDGLLLRATRKIAEVPMQDRERLSGTSTYNLKKLISLFSNGFTAFSIIPLRLSTFVGVGSSILGFCWGLYLIIHKLMYPKLIDAGYSSLMAVMLFVGGMIMIMLGICGEYIGRIYICLNNSPQFVIRETTHMTPENDARHRETR